jgi:trimeric autotransporter adhesin
MSILRLVFVTVMVVASLVRSTPAVAAPARKGLTDGVPAHMAAGQIPASEAAGLAPGCPEMFATGFGVPGVRGLVYAMATFDEDGDGPRPPALFVGGQFSEAGGQPVNNLARWDGTGWSAVGYAIANGVGVTRFSLVLALTVFDEDGPGPAAPSLFVGGSFNVAGDQRAQNIARWNGLVWSTVGSGSGNGVSDLATTSTVTSMIVFDDDGPGAGLPVLIVGGRFSLAGGRSVNNIARWDGTAWSALGPQTANGVIGSASSQSVHALAIFDEDGPGPGLPALFVGGEFTQAGGQAVRDIARWDGSGWSPVGPGLTNTTGASPSGVRALAVFDEDGEGPGAPTLFAGGNFTQAGDVSVSRIARWNGSVWSPLPGPISGLNGNSFVVRALAVFDEDGAGPRRAALFVGGTFTDINNRRFNNFASWNGTAWINAPSISDVGVDSSVRALLVHDEDGTGPGSPILFVGGTFRVVGNQPASGIARWNGNEWFPLRPVPAQALNKPVYALAEFDEDGPGPGAPALFVGGDFSNAGGQYMSRIARWNGTTWSAVGTGVFLSASEGSVQAMTVFDEDGPGPGKPALFVGGRFTSAGGQPARNIARWNGTSWSALGSGPTNGVGGTTVLGVVTSLAVFDPDGSGPRLPVLFVGGLFQEAGGQPARSLARWDGSTLTAVNSGVNGSVNALTVFDHDGPGPGEARLIVAGQFTLGASPVANNIAGMNGLGVWTTLGGGSTNGLNDVVYALTVFDEDGSGPGLPALFAGGGFNRAGGLAVRGLARWNGSVWTTVGAGENNGVGGRVWALTAFDADGLGPDTPKLIVGGSFAGAGGQPARSLARWNGLSWTGLGNGLDPDPDLFNAGTAYGMAVFDDDGSNPGVPGLYIGGNFVSAGDIDSGMLAKWHAPLCERSPGACCAGVTCSVRTADACVGSNTRFAGPGTVCNAPGNMSMPCCRTDYNQDGTRTQADILALLSAFFSGNPIRAALTDFDGSGTRQPADLFAFLNAYFAGGC